MLNKLTKEQEKLLPVVREEWINFCLGGDTSINRQDIHDGIKWLYGLAKLKKPILIFIDGPLACQYGANILKHWVKNKKVIDQVRDQVRGQVYAQVSGQVYDQVRGQVYGQLLGQVYDQVRDQVRGQVYAQVSGQVYGQVRDQVYDQVGVQVHDQVIDQVLVQVRGQVIDQVIDQVHDQVRGQVRDQVIGQVIGQVRGQVLDQVRGQVYGQVSGQVRDQVHDQVRGQVYGQVSGQVYDQVHDQVRGQVYGQVYDQVIDQVIDQVRDQVIGQFYQYFNFSRCDLSDCGWISYGDFFKRIGISITDKLERYKQYVRSGPFLSIFLNGFAIVCCRPKSIKRNSRFSLHCENGPAAEWPNGEKYWFLNGIRMNKVDVMTPAEKLDPKEIMKRENVDERRELIRKVGIERMLSVLKSKTLDSKGDYSLLEIELSPRIKDARYLKMKNPSIGIWHLEGVSRECKTVQDALNWRAGDIKSNWDPSKLT